MISFSQLQKLEISVLRAIRTEGVFRRLDSLATAASQAQEFIGPRAPINLGLNFTLPTRLREDGHGPAIRRPFHVGCLAHCSAKGNEIESLSYSVLIGQEEYPSRRVARKFHFDFEPAILRNPAEAKPTFHLQLCGELSEHHEINGYALEHIAHLLPSWSQPRVPVQPMSLALVLNWLFIEFGGEPPVIEARTSPRWRSLVREAERSILTPYFKECSEFLSGAGNADESFYSRVLYQEK